MDHPSSPHRSVLRRNLSRYANRDDLSKLKGARPLIRGQRPFPISDPVYLPPRALTTDVIFSLYLSPFSLFVSFSPLSSRAHSIIISVVAVFVAVVVGVAKNDRRTLAGLARHPRGTPDGRVIAAKSRG